MFLDDKIIEVFSMCDDFGKNFDDIIQKNSIDARESTKKRKYHRDGTMSDAEVMTILVLFHGSGYRCLKHFYLDHVCKHMRHLFSKVLSYNCFVELQKRAVIKLAVFVKTILMGKCTGISFIDSTPLRVCRNQRILQHKTFKGIAQRGGNARWDGSLASSCTSFATKWARSSISCSRLATLMTGTRSRWNVVQRNSTERSSTSRKSFILMSEQPMFLYRA